MRGIYTSVFDGSTKFSSPCEFDPETKVVSKIELVEDEKAGEDADAVTDEYVTLPDGTDLRETDGVTFTY